MLWRLLFLIAVLAKLVFAGDESSVVREREKALAKALRVKNKAVLFTIVDKHVRVFWRDGSAWRNVSTEMGRRAWVDELMHLRIDSYEAMISKIDLVKPDEAIVTLRESWTLRSPHGSRLEKHFFTSDTWFKRHDTWKLTGRFSQSDPPFRTDAPDRASPR